jgi:RecB family exonuclease/transcriptional regulator with XRE-family HTH domain
METFLSKVCDHLLASYGEQLDELCIVLPNRRGGLFLERQLASRFTKPAWAPSIYSMEDFIWEQSGLQQTDLAEQLFIFYSAYRDYEQEKAESFEAFCKWAPTLLADFNETDSCLADTEKLFGNLSDIREIENWSLGEATLTDFQKQYLHFWKRIGDWYRLYRKMLAQENKAYTGLAYRTVAEKISTPGFGQQWKKIIFAGFNALNPAEERIFTVLQDSGRAETLWDGDRYFLEDNAQEAGRFLRKYRHSYFRPAPGARGFRHIEDRLSTEEKNITVAGVAKMVSQSKAAVHFLETLDKQKRFSPSTAIILSDDQLLLPLLHALPEEAQYINITMGFPLRHTPVSSLVNALFQLHEDAQRFNIHTREGELKFYHTDLIRLLRHPYVRQLLAGTGLPEQLERHIVRFNIIFASEGQLRKATKENENAFELFAHFLRPWPDAAAALQGLQQAIDLLRPQFVPAPSDDPEKKSFSIETEYLFQLSLIVKRARTLQEKWKVAPDIRSLRALVTQQLASTTLPFYGEPVGGLQVMGLLETRTLDFENLIFLSANENLLPGGRSQPTFILYDLRRAFGLPVWHDKDAMTAYNFYRLLVRAKNVFIIHNTDQDTFGGGEKSRFVTQLQHELSVINKKATITETVFDAGIPLSAAPPAPIRIPKDEAVRTKLGELAASGLSPSLLNSFRACSLQFYFHYVASLREPDEVEETIGADTLGTIIHGALEELYKPLIGQALNPAQIDEMKKQVPHTCDAMFARHFSNEEASSGKNLLARRIAVRYISSFLDEEKKTLKKSPLKVEALESDLRFAVNVNGKTIQLRGQADRIDSTPTHIRLVDYKTGKTEKRELNVGDWEEILVKPEIHKSFQLLMYAWLYAKMTGSVLPIQSGIISFRKLKDGLLHVTTPDGGFLLPKTLEEFGHALQKLLETLFSDEREFVQTDELKTCKLCAFKTICRR